MNRSGELGYERVIPIHDFAELRVPKNQTSTKQISCMEKNELDELFDVDEEMLKKMPEWFRKLREAYLKKKSLLNQSEQSV